MLNLVYGTRDFCVPGLLARPGWYRPQFTQFKLEYVEYGTVNAFAGTQYTQITH